MGVGMEMLLHRRTDYVLFVFRSPLLVLVHSCHPAKKYCKMKR